MKEKYSLSLRSIKGEKWEDIEGFEGYYKVSDFGRVKSLRNKKSKRKMKMRILKPQSTLSTCTIRTFPLSKNGEVTNYRVEGWFLNDKH